MNRRNFLSAGAAVLGGEFLAKSISLAATPPASPVRTTTLIDRSAFPEKINLQDTIFDGEKFICLYRGGAPFGPDAKFALAATSAAGKLLWSYPLPKGVVFSLGTRAGAVALFGARSVQLLDPANGSLTDLGPVPGAGPFRYAGDSTMFRIAAGSGEIWTLDDGLVQKTAGLASPTLTRKFPLNSFVAPATFAVVDAVGTSMAVVSINAPSIKDTPISSSVIANSRAAVDEVFTRAGVDTSNPRMGTSTFIGAIGGDQTGAVYAAVNEPKQPRGVLSIIKLDQNGIGSNLGMIRLPAPFVTTLTIAGSELAAVCGNGQAAWYQLPLT